MTDIIAPAGTVLFRLQRRGIPLDVAERDKLRSEAKAQLREADYELGVATQQFHEKRQKKVATALFELQTEKETTISDAPCGCKKHPDYCGVTKRSKCEGCKYVYLLAAPLRIRLKDLGKCITGGKTKLRSLADGFQSGSDDHWRMLLFNKEIGCGLKPVSRTTKRRDPKVDDDAIEKLSRKNPDNRYLRLRVAVQAARTRLSTRLSVEPEADGRVHFAYSMHRSGPGRIASGSDDTDADKYRRSPGNAQNLAPKDRSIYKAEKGFVFVECDWSQIEARVMATLAGEERMLAAWRRGADIHALNGAALSRALGVPCTPEESKEKTFRFAGETRTYRYAAKRMTHGWNYGMEAPHTAELFGLTVPVAQKLIDSYFEQWPKLRLFQNAMIALANSQRFLVNSFGRKYPFFHVQKNTFGQWVISDPNEAVSFPAQADVSDMCKKVLPELDATATAVDGELLNTKHDSFLSMIPWRLVPAYCRMTKAVMEQAWPQIRGPLANEPVFRCPTEFEVGLNWGPRTEGNPDGMEECSVDAEGLDVACRDWIWGRCGMGPSGRSDSAVPVVQADVPR